MREVKKFPLVFIEWADSSGVSPDWEELRDDFKPHVLHCKSVGWLVHDDNKCKVVVPHLTDPRSSKQQGCGDMLIPTPAVVRMVRLKEPSTKRG